MQSILPLETIDELIICSDEDARTLVANGLYRVIPGAGESENLVSDGEFLTLGTPPAGHHTPDDFLYMEALNADMESNANNPNDRPEPRIVGNVARSRLFQIPKVVKRGAGQSTREIESRRPKKQENLGKPKTSGKRTRDDDNDQGGGDDDNDDSNAQKPQPKKQKMNKDESQNDMEPLNMYCFMKPFKPGKENNDKILATNRGSLVRFTLECSNFSMPQQIF